MSHTLDPESPLSAIPTRTDLAYRFQMVTPAQVDPVRVLIVGAGNINFGSDEGVGRYIRIDARLTRGQ